MSVRTCTVNLRPSDGVPAVRLNQYDTGVTLLFTVMDGDSPADFDSGTTVTIQGTRPSGTGYSLSATLDGNFVTVDSTIEMTREFGDSVCELRFSKGGVDVGTGNFKIGVEKAAFANDTIDENVNHWNQLAQQVHADTVTATNAALAAGNATDSAQSAATNAADSADRAFTYAKVAQDAKDDIHEYISDAEAWATGTREGQEVPVTDETHENNAKYYSERAAEHVTTAGEWADAAEDSAHDSEAYAIGTRDGVAVGSSDPAYHNNSKYWAENSGGANIAPVFDDQAPYSAGDYVLHDNYLYRFTVNHAAGAWNASHVTAVKVGGELSDLKGDIKETVDQTEGEIDFVKSQIEQITPSLSSEAKIALLECFKHIAWTDQNGQQYYDNLETSLNNDGYPKLVASFNQSSNIVYTDDNLNTLKQYLTVKQYTSKNNSTVIPSSDYTLSGILNAGYSVVKVSYNGISTTFSVDVVDFYNISKWEHPGPYLTKINAGGNPNMNEVASRITINDSDYRRTFVTSRGKTPCYYNGVASNYYPIPVPSEANRFKIESSLSDVYVFAHTVQLSNGVYGDSITANRITWTRLPVEKDFSNIGNLFMIVNLKYTSNNGTAFPSEPNITLTFSKEG